MSYSSVVKKNNMYIVQKQSGNAYISSATSAINEAEPKRCIQISNNKFNSKINTHLLDHGYGATPQTSYDPLDHSRLSDDSVVSYKGFTQAADTGITKYYKVNLSFHFVYNPLFGDIANKIQLTKLIFFKIKLWLNLIMRIENVVQ